MCLRPFSPSGVSGRLRQRHRLRAITNYNCGELSRDLRKVCGIAIFVSVEQTWITALRWVVNDVGLRTKGVI